MTISPELLAAYADGELDAGTARTVETEIARDPRLQADLAAHRALRSRLATHFSPIVEQPVPDRLRQAVLADGESSSVIDFAERARKDRGRARPARWGHIVGPALAASLVLALLGYSLRPADSSYVHGKVASALDSQLVATQKTDAPVRILLSFQDKHGHYCRGFAQEARAGVACRDARGWRLLRTFKGTKSDATEYRQASSPDMEVMNAAQNMAAGEAFDAAQEQQAVRQGWRSAQTP
jgi:hypothetical protein